MGFRTTAARARILVLALAAVAGAAFAADPLPIALFASRPVVTLPRLSPDGKHLVVTRRLSVGGRDAQVMTVYRTSDLTQISQVRLPNLHVPTNYWWVSNTRIVVAPGKEYGSLEAPVRMGELLAMDMDGTGQEYLFGYERGKFKRSSVENDYASAQFARVADERDGRFYINEHQWGGNSHRTNLYQINAKGGARKLMADAPLPHATFVVQRDGSSKFAYAVDEKDLQLLQYDAEKKSWSPRGVINGERLEPLSYGEGDATMYARVRKGNGPYSLVRESVVGGQRDVLASHRVGSIDDVQWGPRALKPIAASTYVGIPKAQYIEPESPEALLHKDISLNFPGQFVDFKSFSDDGSKLLFTVTSDKNPGEVYLMDRQAKKAQRIFTAIEGIDPARMAERRPIMFKARDGLELHGYLTLPAGAGENNLPMVLMPHGGPHYVSDHWFFDTDAQFLASRGYAVLQVNFRGSTGRGDAFHSIGYRHWGDKMQDDLIDGVKWSIENGYADPKRICSYGGSFGAYASMMTAIREPEMFKCAVGYSGLYDLASMYETDNAKADPTLRAFLTRTIGQDAAQLAAWSPAQQAAKLTVPVMLAHGEEDEITPVKQAKAMHEALLKAGKPHEWMLVEAEGHGFYAEKNRIAFYEKLEAFLAKHIGK